MAQPKILVIDDNPVDREVARRLLFRDYEVLEAATGREGLLVCQRERPACVLLDHRLPGQDGAAWLRRFLDERVGVVMLTGMGDEALAVACLTAGAHDYLSKRRLTRETLDRAIRNATERARLTQEVDLHRRILQQLPLGVAVLRWEDRRDPGSFRALWQNAAAETIAGVTDAMLGKTLREAVPGALGTPIPGLLAEAVVSGQPQHLDALQFGDASIRDTVYQLTMAPLGDDLVALLFEDVKAKVEAAEAHEKLEVQMRAAQRMEAIARLAGGVAHDFNNLLCVIQSYGSMLKDQFEPTDPVYEDLDEILQAAARAARLTSQLLAFSRRQIQALRILNLNDTVSEVQRMLRRLIGEDLDLVTRLPDDLWLVKVDPTHVEQILVNLAVNARDAMPAGGTLIIETANVELDAARGPRKGMAIEAGSYVLLAVTDTGCGMPAEVQDHIFEPFYTTKPQERGTGLGLSTVFGIVKQSGGHIFCYSEPGRGTTFKVYLPRVDAPPSPALEARMTPALVRGDETLLVVEDDEMVRKVACRVLGDRGYHVLEAAHGEDAIQVAANHGGPIHLMLTDIVMPGFTGRELARRLSVHRPAMKVIYMSGYTETAIVHQGVLDEGVVFVQKPFTVEGLTLKVREALDDV